MNTYSLKLSALCAIAVLAGCQTMSSPQQQADEAPSPKNPEFASEMTKFNAQFPSDKATRYEDESIKYNNAQKFDEKGGCHGKSKYPVTIVLVLDASGTVTNSITDVENSKAACFRKTYASAQFPRPPMAPYRKAILLK